MKCDGHPLGIVKFWHYKWNVPPFHTNTVTIYKM